MKAKLLLVFFSLLVAFPLAAQNRWGIMGGANFSTTSAEGFNGGQAAISAVYMILD